MKFSKAKLQKKMTMVWDSRRFAEQICYFLDESCCFFDEKILLPLGLTAAASATDTIIQKKLVTSLGYENLEIREILLKRVTEIVANEVNEQ